MKVHALFGEESALMDRILFLRAGLAKSAAALAEGDALRKSITDFDGKIDNVRKKIVATKEGGAVTGEERLREHTDQLYGAILSYEGKPGDYQIAYIDALKRELADVTKEFEQLLATELTILNESLKAKGQQSVPPPPPRTVPRPPCEGFRPVSARASSCRCPADPTAGATEWHVPERG